MREIMNRKQAAEYLGIGVRTLDALRKQGLVRDARVGGAVRIRCEWLDALFVPTSDVCVSAIIKDICGPG